MTTEIILIRARYLLGVVKHNLQGDRNMEMAKIFV